MKMKYTLAAMAMTSLGAHAAAINIGGTGDGGLDGTSVANWTTNNTVYVDSTPGPANSGLAFNWENVTTNTSTVDIGNNRFDTAMAANTNYTVGHGYLFNESFDLSSTTGGIEGLTIGWDFNAVNNTNWSPIIAVDGAIYRWNHSGNSFNGNGDLSGNSFLANSSLNATNSTWGLVSDTQDGLTIGGATPDLQATSGTVQFGFIQWNASSGGSLNNTGTVAFDKMEYGVTYTPVPEPSSAALLGLGGLALILRRRK